MYTIYSEILYRALETYCRTPLAAVLHEGQWGALFPLKQTKAHIPRAGCVYVCVHGGIRGDPFRDDTVKQHIHPGVHIIISKPLTT